jgi:hypothetical protein
MTETGSVTGPRPSQRVPDRKRPGRIVPQSSSIIARPAGSPRRSPPERSPCAPPAGSLLAAGLFHGREPRREVTEVAGGLLLRSRGPPSRCRGPGEKLTSFERFEVRPANL